MTARDNVLPRAVTDGAYSYEAGQAGIFLVLATSKRTPFSLGLNIVQMSKLQGAVTDRAYRFRSI